MSEYFEKAAIIWDNDPYRLNMANTIADTMIRVALPKSTDTILDYGTGTGNIALRLYPHVKKIIAVDSARNMLAVLGQKLEKEGITSIEPREWSIGHDTTNLPRFDLIVSSMTLHHVMDTSEAARTFHEILVPGGKIALADLDCENGEFHEKPGIADHNGFDRNKLMQVFSGAGFQNIRFDEAATVSKKSSLTGNTRDFTIFLMTADRL
ncbi:MAG: class I SAM-dependent methyltransferase [Methanoregula sp.]|jgi:ubiquinone/menaquinone biosynthesis C-methylase UbiE